jgi:SAM-dependent methyltransferase
VNHNNKAHGDTVDTEILIATYPRKRPELSSRMRSIYTSHYLDNRDGSGALTRLKNGLEGWMHHQVAAGQNGSRLLELGAGTLNHLNHEPEGLFYSCVEPFEELWRGRSALGKINAMYRDIEEVPSAERFDRIFSVAVLEHVLDLPVLIAQSAVLLAEGGIFQAGIPAEGGALWGMAWRMTTGLSFRLRTGLPYGEMMRHEHVNEAPEIRQLIEYYFEDVVLQQFPLPHLHFSLYHYLQASRPRLDRCHQTISNRSTRELQCAQSR